MAVAAHLTETVLFRWYDANTTLETAQSATDLFKPDAIDDAGFRWVEVPRLPNGAAPYVLLRGRCDDGAGAVTTSPIVQLWGAFPDPSATEGDWGAAAAGTLPEGTVFTRLDNVDQSAAGLTLTFEGTPSASNMVHDGTFFYTDPTSLTGYYSNGAKYVGVACGTAANIASITDVRAQIMFAA